MASSGPSQNINILEDELSAAIKNSEFFRSLVENGSDAIVSIDKNSRIIYANQSVERVFGYTPEEMLGENLTMIMPDRFHTAHFDAIDQYIDTGERTFDWNDIELPAQHKDGHEISLSITFEEHSFEGQRIFSGIMRDISDRKSHEENLVTLQEMAQDLMQIQDRKKIAERVVTAAEKTLDFPIVSVFFYDESTHQLEPVVHSEAVHETLDDIPQLGEGSLAWAAFQEGEPRRYVATEDTESPVFRADGPIESEYIFPLSDHGCLLVSNTEESSFDERRFSLAQILAANAEAALKRAQRETERERERERLERFASIVSHDLRDPINTARATLAVARAGREGAFDELDDIFDRMDELIGDVLQLAKEGQSVGETKHVDLHETIRDAWSTVGTDGATIQIGDVSTVSADPERLRTLFENLFRNAIEHAGPEVTIQVDDLDDRPGFYVKDDGPGFGDVDTDQLFEYGYSTEQDNTGFGLNIVQEIVTAHDWSIEAVPETTAGARFDIVTR